MTLRKKIGDQRGLGQKLCCFWEKSWKCSILESFNLRYEADLNLEHDDHMTLIEDVAWSVDGHPWEMLDLLWIPEKTTWKYTGHV